MNDEEKLILIKNEDKTETVQCCKYEGGMYKVSYYNSSKVYKYAYGNVQWLHKTKTLNIENKIVYKNDIPILGITKMIQFEDYYKIFFKNSYKKLYHESELKIEDTVLDDSEAKNCFSYLKELAEKISIKFDDDSSFLSKQYNYLRKISPNSILGDYLKPQGFHKINRNSQVIFPFGFNISQKIATEEALNNKLSLIEGPPGTGKTQTILNIIANAVLNGETVAIVSNNNSATANVFEKLEKYNLDFIVAYLGNNGNKDKFFENQKSSYPDIENWGKSYEEVNNIKTELERSKKSLNFMLEKKNDLASLKIELSHFEIEYKYYEKNQNINKDQIKGYLSLYRHKADIINRIVVEYSNILEDCGILKFKDKLRFLFKYGIISFKFYYNSPGDIVNYLNKFFYITKIKELKDCIDKLEGILKKYNFEEEMKEYSNKSMILLKAELYNRFKSRKSRNIFNKDVLWKNFFGFIKEYPVIMSTTHSIRSCASYGYLFDYVIIDEASQVDIVTGALALSCAKNAVIVGDLKQLPNVVSQNEKELSDSIFDKYKLDNTYRYSENSLLSSLSKLYTSVPKTLLREHYRCNPKIIDFCNKKFYNDELIILTEENEDESPLKIYKTVEGNHARGKYNQRQIDVIKNEIIPELDDNKSIGIIAPYRDQVNGLRNSISEEDIQIDTVHKYQGREKEIIILSTVTNEQNEFVDDSNLLNVAISRAEKQLIVVVADNESLINNGNIGDLISYIEYNNLEIINSKVCSVFDLLYRSREKELLEYMSKNRRVSKYDSENLINILIEKILEKNEFNDFVKVMHYPLNNLIKDMSKLDDEEIKYATNVLTHTDFLIYDKFSKIPVLVVEVDGYKFHDNNPKQLRRDKIKDNILQKYDIPLLRLKTNESGEEERLYKALMNRNNC